MSCAHDWRDSGLRRLGEPAYVCTLCGHFRQRCNRCLKGWTRDPDGPCGSCHAGWIVRAEFIPVTRIVGGA